MKRCEYMDEISGRCNANAMVKVDKHREAKVVRYQVQVSAVHSDETVQVIYPISHDSFCYYHRKVENGLLPKVRRRMFR